MVNARLHIICGNCGCNDMFKFRVDPKGKDVSEDVAKFEPAYYIICRNCTTLHNLEDNMEEWHHKQKGESMEKECANCKKSKKNTGRLCSFVYSDCIDIGYKHFEPIEKEPAMEKIKEYPETHQIGFITMHHLPALTDKNDLGIKIANDGRVWICIDGAAFLRFTPTKKKSRENGN